MIQRAAADALKRLAGQFPVVGITGPRQSGKSTLATMVFPDKEYVSFDDRDTRLLASASPRDFLRAFPDGAVIDEAQKVPELFDAVKYDVDRGTFTPGKFILTGSSQFRLKENMSDSLAGRVAFLKLLPFSIHELRNESLLPEDPFEFFVKGQYPPLYDGNKRFNAADWFDNYLESYLELDVRDQINVSNLQTFKRFIQICAVYSGGLLSMDEIARDTGVSAPTVKSWLSILEASYIIHFLHPDTKQLGPSLIKTPKLFFTDTGLLCHLLRMETAKELILSRDRGKVIETGAVAELLKYRCNAGRNPDLTFYRDTGGLEVDAVADWKRTFVVEIKGSSETEKKYSAGVRKYLTRRGDDTVKGNVFYLGDLTCDINGVKYVGWKDWGESGACGGDPD